MTFFLILVILGGAGAAIAANTRAAKLKRLAKAINWLYSPRLETVLTEEARFSLSFFQQGLHLFSHILTGQDAGAFVRMSDDCVVDTASGKQTTYTLFTAELTRGTFAPLLLRPRAPGLQEPAHPALPAPLAERYRLNAPQDYRLPEPIVGFLGAVKNCYIELTPTCFVYHEFDVKPVSQLQAFRFRARQLLTVFTQKNTPSQPAVVNPVLASLSEAELQANLLLKMRTSPRGKSGAAVSGGGRYVYAFILLAFLGALVVAAGYILRHIGH